jgi:hypothetical protein
MPGVLAGPGATASIDSRIQMNLYCQNYATCHGVVIDRGTGDLNEIHARAKGWHIFHGHSMGGDAHDAVLCGKCVDSRRRDLTPAPPLQPGQQELWAIDEAGS